jgi:hypothetical protein
LAAGGRRGTPFLEAFPPPPQCDEPMAPQIMLFGSFLFDAKKSKLKKRVSSQCFSLKDQTYFSRK